MTAVEKPGPHDMDQPVAILLDPGDALKALLKADPDAKPVPQDEPVKDQGDALNPYGENWSDHG